MIEKQKKKFNQSYSTNEFSWHWGTWCKVGIDSGIQSTGIFGVSGNMASPEIMCPRAIFLREYGAPISVPGKHVSLKMFFRNFEKNVDKIAQNWFLV